MNPNSLLRQLTAHQDLIRSLLDSFSEDMIRWRPYPEHWSALEVLCHLVDEEREDFRTRVFHSLRFPQEPPPPIRPADWITERAYQEQDWQEKRAEWLTERSLSLTELGQLESPHWERPAYTPEGGPTRSALSYLANWVAHDLLHLRQLTRLRYLWLKESGISLGYAGSW